MTDFTTNAPLVREKTAQPTREYYVYFGIIFLATLPLSFLTWTLTALRQFALPEKGPIAKAWTQARIITPHIFSA